MESTLSKSVDCGDWVLNLTGFSSHGLAAGTSKGLLNLLSWEGTPQIQIKAHQGAVNRARKVDENSMVTCGNDGTVKLWDLRQGGAPAVATMSNTREIPFISLDYGHGLVAAGTELQKQDSELLLWDLKKPEAVYREFKDSHHDDITEVRFHPTRSDLLLSGSTDGYVNVYDLKVAEEDDALIQVVNFASIHSANFLAENRLYALSHMETFCVDELVDTTTEESVEPTPVEYGDIREKWGCEYVVDLFAPGYLCCGSNSRSELRLYQFDKGKENFGEIGSHILFPGAHGEEIVRDLVIRSNVVYTGGEDGTVKLWKPPCELADTTEHFFGSESGSASVAEIPGLAEKKKKKHEHKHKHHEHKHKHKHKSSTRFKPY